MMSPQTKKPAGRPRVFDVTVSFKVGWADYFLLGAAAAYDQKDVAEFLRMQVTELRHKLRRSPDFKDWLERHKDELAKERGVDIKQIW